METMVLPPRTGMEAFKLMPEGTLCQLINDVLIMSPAATPNHQRVSKKIFNSLLKIVEEREFGEMFYSPIDVFFDDANVCQPDIVFVSKEHAGIINWNKGIMGAPDLVIEILSKGNRKYDLKDKKEIYERFGVKEYWVVDPETKWCEGFLLTENQFKSIGESTGEFTIQMFDLQIGV